MKRIVNLNETFVYVINEDLGMSKGKIAAQVSHVAMLLADKTQGILGRAIVLKAPEKTLQALRAQYPDEIEYIEDAGLTEVPKGSLTCIGFVREGKLGEISKQFRLL